MHQRFGSLRPVRSKPLRHLRYGFAAPLLVGLLVMFAGCAQQRLRDESLLQLRSGAYEEAVDVLERGLKEHPESALLRSGLLNARNEALAKLLTEAAAARASGQLDEAQSLLARAERFDSGGKRVSVLQLELAAERRQRQALTEALSAQEAGQSVKARNIVREALKDNPRHPELQALQQKLEAIARHAQVRAAQKGLSESRPISLDFRDANLRTVLDLVTRHSGINFVMDKDVRADVRVTVLLKSARVEDAIDLITSTHGLTKKVLDGNTILIYPNTPEKQREYQEQVIRVFHLASGEAKSAAAFLKSMMRIRDPHVDDRSNMLAIRESPENIELAERLLALYDTQEPEVLLELEVIEVRSSRLLDLGLLPPSSLSLTVLNPTGGKDGLTWDSLRNVPGSRIGVGIGGVLVNFKREIGDFNTLANPRIRAKNKEKAKVLIGDKVPVITATTGQGGFVSDSVSYLDVGLKLDVEPTVYADDEVTIKVGLEVSSLAREVRTASGSLAYQIGTRNASTVLRLRDGETQLLAGLINREDRSSTTGLPGLADLPVAGRLFSSTRDEGQRTELVLAITPRVLRNIRRPAAAEAEIWVGTEAQPRLRAYGGRVAPPDDVPSSTVVNPSTGGVLVPPPVTGAGGAATGGLPQMPVPVPSSGVGGASAAQGEVGLQWLGPQEVKRGEEFTITLEVNSLVPLRAAPLQLSFDRSRLAVVNVEEMDFLRHGGMATNFTKSVLADEGRVNAGVMRTQTAGRVGRGGLLQVKLKAISPGPAQIALTMFEPVVNGESSPKVGLPLIHKLEVR